MITLLLVAVALGFLFWPKGGFHATPTLPDPQDLFRVHPIVTEKAPPAPAARDAIDSLLEVRDRLAATDALDEDSAKAVDVLWLDLLHGSAK